MAISCHLEFDLTYTLAINNCNVIILSKSVLVSPTWCCSCRYCRRFSCGRSLNCSSNIGRRCWLCCSLFCCRFNDCRRRVLQCRRNNCISSVQCDALVKICYYRRRHAKRFMHICHIITPSRDMQTRDSLFIVSSYPARTR